MRTVNGAWNSLAVARRQEGFAFNEILVAIAFITIGILGFSLNTVAVIQGNYISGNFTVATNLAQDKMEQLKAQTTLTDVNNCPGSGERDLTATGAAGGIYDRCWVITDFPFGSGLKQIDVTVSWRDYVTRVVTVSTLIFTG